MKKIKRTCRNNGEKYIAEVSILLQTHRRKKEPPSSQKEVGDKSWMMVGGTDFISLSSS
jgi:hypothetical protein